jgi:hypothetical protein
VETRLKGYKYIKIERDFFNKLGVLIDVILNLVYCYLYFSADARIQGKEEKGTDIDSLQNNISI